MVILKTFKSSGVHLSYCSDSVNICLSVIDVESADANEVSSKSSNLVCYRGNKDRNEIKFGFIWNIATAI